MEEVQLQIAQAKTMRAALSVPAVGVCVMESMDQRCYVGLRVQAYAEFRNDAQIRHMGYFGIAEQTPYGPVLIPHLPGTERGGLNRRIATDPGLAVRRDDNPGARTQACANQLDQEKSA